MIYGAKNIRWAPIKAEPAGALPTYDAVRRLGELNQLADSPSYNEARASGDNKTARFISMFKEVGIDVTILDMTNENASAVTGATIDETTAKNLHFKDTDNAPYGGITFFITELMEENVVKHKGIFYPKARAAMQGQTYDTMGQSITLQGKKLKFVGLAANSGDWKVESPYFDSEAEADAWAESMLAGG